MALLQELDLGLVWRQAPQAAEHLSIDQVRGLQLEVCPQVLVGQTLARARTDQQLEHGRRVNDDHGPRGLADGR